MSKPSKPHKKIKYKNIKFLYNPLIVDMHLNANLLKVSLKMNN